MSQDYEKTHREIVRETLATSGPLSSYGVMHVARGRGYKMSPSSVRSRIAEMEQAGQIVKVGTETTPKRTAARYAIKA